MPPRQKRPLRWTRTPSIDKCLSSAPAHTGRSSRFQSSNDHACARPPEVRDHRNPSPYPRLCHRGPASDVPSPPEHEAEWLDPDVNTRTRRLLPTSATRTPHEHNHAIVRIPGSCLSTWPAQLALDREETSGRVTPSAPSTADAGRPQVSTFVRTLRRNPDASTGYRPRSHGPGTRQLSLPGASHHPRSRTSRDGGASPQPDPLGHLVSQNCGSISRNLRCSTSPPGRSRTRCLRQSRPQAPLPRINVTTSGLRGLRTSRSREDGRPNRTQRRSTFVDLTRLLSTDDPEPFAQPSCPPGPRAASPDSPRREPRSAAPKVPSIDESPSRPRRALALLAPSGEDYPQVVTSLWITHGAFVHLARDPETLTDLRRRRVALRCD